MVIARNQPWIEAHVFRPLERLTVSRWAELLRRKHSRDDVDRGYEPCIRVACSQNEGSSPFSPGRGREGKGVVLYFRVGERFDTTTAQAKSIGAHIIRGPKFNEPSHQDELWVRDPDGYTVVLAGPAAWAS